MLFAPKNKGQGLVEYALILVLVAVVVILILAMLGPWFQGWLAWFAYQSSH
jgi:pilus assembly protein Flp/PilA